MGIKRIGVLTGGGDSSGVNAALRSIYVAASQKNMEVVGILEGWRGLLTKNVVPLTEANTSEISHLAGTIIGTSRTNPKKIDQGVETIWQSLKELHLDGLIAIGGDDTLGVATYLGQSGLPVVGLPQTIDNDIFGTDYCIGFDTAVNEATKAIDCCKPSNLSHRKDMIVEVMGRENGSIALVTALSVQADYVIVPERPFHLEHLIDTLQAKKQKGKKSCLVVTAEGLELSEYDRGEAVDAFGNRALEGVSRELARVIMAKTNWDFRVQILGFIIRGGRPTTYEIQNSVEMGHYAVELLAKGELGYLVARQGGTLAKVPLEDIGGKKAIAPKHLLAMAHSLGILGV